ncbi:hypothetical protein ACVC7V_12445 [Hydrogenophaga sp. A37]|uniref:AraC family transcriptional regulator n=1 Tax=Hydrogenophaga sp. A37 TaxID=1945864 RepID=UPI00117AC401|nr:AraC family transcriptional regulator [Hydrogenophaga sp. A37]
MQQHFLNPYQHQSEKGIHVAAQTPPTLFVQGLTLAQSTEVTLSVGFSDFSHFQKCFRQIVGQTPGDLRRARALV